MRRSSRWAAVFQQGGIPDEIPEVQIEPGTHNLVQILVELNLASSNREARRFIQQGGVRVNGVKCEDFSAHVVVQNGTIIQVGKRRYVKCRC